MELGVVFPQDEIGTDPEGIVAWAAAVEAGGFGYVDVFDHVLGADRSSRPDRLRRGLEGWRSVGATHVSVHGTGQGRGAGPHVAFVEAVAAVATAEEVGR